MMLQLPLEPKNYWIISGTLYWKDVSAQEAILTTYICKLSSVEYYLLDYG